MRMWGRDPSFVAIYSGPLCSLGSVSRMLAIPDGFLEADAETKKCMCKNLEGERISGWAERERPTESEPSVEASFLQGALELGPFRTSEPEAGPWDVGLGRSFS